MRSDKLLELLGEIDDDIIEKAVTAEDKKKSLIFEFRIRKRIGTLINNQRMILATSGVVILIAILFGAKLLIIDREGSDDLYQSNLVNVRYINQLPVNRSMSNESLSYNYSEEELFERADLIFEGSVISIKLIEVSFDSVKEYRSLIKLEPTDIMKGNYSKSEIVIMSPDIPSKDTWIEDSELLTKIKIGTKGVFLVNCITDQSTWKENDISFKLNNICDGTFADGMRFGFIKEGNRVIFDTAFTGLQSSNWDNAINYIRKMTK